MRERLDLAPEQLAQEMRLAGLRRGWIACGTESERPRVSHPFFAPIADCLARDERDFDRHEAVFLEVGARSGALLTAFVHRCERGQTQGGLRHWPYANVEALLRDGLRLSRAMGRKSALAGLWWGGGKGIIARVPGDAWREPAFREQLYAEYGRFVSSLRGCYVTAEDAGTTPLDMAVVHRHTRFATCVPPELGGSGNPSAMTALGVVRAIESALDFLGLGGLPGKRIAMQGAGQVGSAMLEHLFEAGVRSAVVSELSAERRDALARFHGSRALELRDTRSAGDAILAEPCDVLVPNALGGVLGPKTIPSVQARLVCGAANNPLEDDVRDGAALAQRGITYVPDFVANRMGIVSCCDEQAGLLPRDPAVLAHLDPGVEQSIPMVVRHVLSRARNTGCTPVEAANALADAKLCEPHPLHGARARSIVASLLQDGWAGR